jgi:hypothetical protein
MQDDNEAVAEAVLMDDGSPRFAGNLEEAAYHDRLWRGTTSVEAADKNGWVVSITPAADGCLQ